MSFFDKIKSALGLSEPKEKPELHQRDRFWPESRQENPSFEPPNHDGPTQHFQIFTDPLEMHKYFEQQMDNMMKSFGFFGDGFTHFFNFSESEDFPQLERIPHGPEEEAPSSSQGNLREQFLKPGFEKANGQDRKDEDLDGKLDIRDWGSVFKGENSVIPHQRQPRNYFFGQSVVSKTITNPDGSTETQRTVKDNEGNEETTVTRKIGDKEYSVTKRRNKDGKEEIIENLMNLDKEIDKFFPQRRTVPELDNQPSPWPYFDRFFK